MTKNMLRFPKVILCSFQNPEPIDYCWNGVRDARKYGNSCPTVDASLKFYGNNLLQTCFYLVIL